MNESTIEGLNKKMENFSTGLTPAELHAFTEILAAARRELIDANDVGGYDGEANDMLSKLNWQPVLPPTVLPPPIDTNSTSTAQ